VLSGGGAAAAERGGVPPRLLLRLRQVRLLMTLMTSCLCLVRCAAAREGTGGGGVELCTPSHACISVVSAR
jgi:hypothetical protein